LPVNWRARQSTFRSGCHHPGFAPAARGHADAPPPFTKVNPADQPILYIALTSPTLPLWQLGEFYMSALQDWVQSWKKGGKKMREVPVAG